MATEAEIRAAIDELEADRAAGHVSAPHYRAQREMLDHALFALSFSIDEIQARLQLLGERWTAKEISPDQYWAERTPLDNALANRAAQSRSLPVPATKRRGLGRLIGRGGKAPEAAPPPPPVSPVSPARLRPTLGELRPPSLPPNFSVHPRPSPEERQREDDYRTNMRRRLDTLLQLNDQMSQLLSRSATKTDTWKSSVSELGARVVKAALAVRDLTPPSDRFEQAESLIDEAIETYVAGVVDIVAGARLDDTAKLDEGSTLIEVAIGLIGSAAAAIPR